MKKFLLLTLSCFLISCNSGGLVDTPANSILQSSLESGIKSNSTTKIFNYNILQVDHSGNLYTVGSYFPYQISSTILKYSNSKWKKIGESFPNAGINNMAITNDGAYVYVTVTVANNSPYEEIYKCSSNGDTRQRIDDKIFTYSDNSPPISNIAIDGKDNAYVTASINQGYYQVYEYDQTNNNWFQLGKLPNNVIASGGILVDNNNNLFVNTWINGKGYFVYEYPSGGNSWVPLAQINPDGSYDAMALDNKNNLYISYDENNFDGNAHQVYKYNGNNNNWKVIGNFSSSMIITAGNNLYGSDIISGTVLQFNKSASTWDQLGAMLPSGIVPTITADNFGNVYAYSGLNSTYYVYMFAKNSKNWQQLATSW